MSKYADLHMHSHVSSDGQYTPQELIKIAQSKGLGVIAVADHNSTQSVKETIKLGEEVGIHVIPAVELDCHFKGSHLHILGYGIDPDYPPILEYEQVLLKQDQANSIKLIEAIENIGLLFDSKKVYQLAKNGVVNGEMIAEVVLSDSRNDHNPLLTEFRDGGSRSDNPLVNFYWDICAQGKPAYVPGADYRPLEDIIEMIKGAGGIAIFAHPGNNIKQDRELAIDIYNQGLSGFEVYSSYHDSDTTQFYLNLANELDALITVGSDFHGKTKPSIQMGGVEVPNERVHLTHFFEVLGLDIKLPLEKITVETIVYQPIEKVWKTLTTPEKINEWNSASPEWESVDAQVDLREGGVYSSHMRSKDLSEGFDFKATITKVDAPHELIYKLEDGRAVITRLSALNVNQTKIIQAFDPEETIPQKYQLIGWQAILLHLKDIAEQ